MGMEKAATKHGEVDKWPQQLTPILLLINVHELAQKNNNINASTQMALACGALHRFPLLLHRYGIIAIGTYM